MGNFTKIVNNNNIKVFPKKKKKKKKKKQRAGSFEDFENQRFV